MPIIKKKKLVYIDVQYGKREQKEKWFESPISVQEIDKDIEQFRYDTGCEIVSKIYNQSDDYYKA